MDQELDFSECEREPLRTSGFIQPHGGLIAFGHDRKVSHASANLRHYLGIGPEEVLHRDLSQFCSADRLAAIERSLPFLREGVVERLAWENPTYPCGAWLHVNGGLYLLELEDADQAVEMEPAAAADALRDFLASAARANSIESLAQQCADALAGIAGYDRVMIYKFHEDWSGQVIAEHRTHSAEPYLGLRYPATDIPSQARQLYTLNLLRALWDVHSIPVAILALPGGEPLDLTYSVLRSMSPYHVEYLRNMNVGATLTASLMVDGKLWGMLACHHLAGKPVPAWIRNAAAAMAGAVSARIAALEKWTADRAAAKTAWQLEALADEIDTAAKIAEALCFGKNRLHSLFDIDSAAIYTDGACISVGDAPQAAWIRSFVDKLMATNQDVFSFSDPQSRLSCAPCADAAGALAIVLTRKPTTVILCFRTEFEQELTWGGDSMQAAIRQPGSERLSPRKSFAAYKQTIRGQSLKWTGNEMAMAKGLLTVFQPLLEPDHRAAAAAIRDSVQRLSREVPGSPIFRSLLDVVSEGMSLFVRDHSGAAVPAFASQALLRRFGLDDGGPEFSLQMADFFRHIGLPGDLLRQTHFGPQEVQVQTGRSANRAYLVQLKQILEVTTEEARAFLAVLVFSDITRQARLLEATEAARKRADHASQIKSAFLANTTHEVRTPMNGILGMAHLLKSTALDPKQMELVEVIERSGSALLRVIDDILDFSKVEAGKLTLESVPFNLQELLQDIVRLFRPLASKLVELSLAVENDVPVFLIGDPGRLRQVIINLMGNAVKFTHEGHVRLEVRQEKASPVYVTLNFLIADTGIGIPEEKAARLFERFDQADASISGKYGGSGLGLAISKDLITLMGGHIKVTSAPGKGTTLLFKLPFLIDEPHPADRSAVPESGVKDNLSLQSLARSCESSPPQEIELRIPVRVLLVDDNAVNRKVGAGMLQQDGCIVTVAAGGDEAVQLSKQDGFDLILMDCQMPDMDGYAAAMLIREGEAGRKRIPIIAVTAGLATEQEDVRLAVGMDDFLAKPIDPAELRRLVRKWALPPASAPPLENASSHLNRC